ncbi:MAG: alpha-1,4-glucan--maltose-1-phosphate maltosyltransferase [Candidatus Binatus sp.]|uniref:alpha-1,4-glucan--maltose-1-phosphate maltosyltransferase n=1 Tax=Candidatus Binatus sp. TaxID=2811406 RepID=UPI003BAE794D
MSSYQTRTDFQLISPVPRLSHIIIEEVTPSVDGGRYPAKRIAGEPCVVEADIFRDGHQVLRAAVKWRRKRDEVFDEAPMAPFDNDRWRGEFIPTDNTRYVFTIEAWTDLFASWLADFTKKVNAARPVASDILEGIALVEKMFSSAKGADRESLERLLARLRKTSDGPTALASISEAEISAVTERVGERFGLTRFEPNLELVVDREKARYGTWYEMFVRSQGREPGKPGTFHDAERRLPELRDLGFDVVYLAPIHPIGHTNRKSPGNSLNGGSNSPGSPWAIGSEAGGHTAIDPSIGTLGDFDRFNAAANRLGMEVALDFAIQCSPDHPWVREHPNWFHHRPDGSIKYAENPPKEYEDIYPIDFDTPDQRGLFEAMLGVLRFWRDHGVKIFRVDNPHTKPVQFWNWLINEVQATNPEVIFLAEAFTRPKLMKALAKAGFTQSYTYFTWRNTKSELTEYMTELTQTPMKEYFRPNFFTNTPDILSPVLQTGGRAAFKMRLVLASTLSPSYGIYSGYELCEHQAVPGTEEYLNSEKYELKVRDWNQPGNIKEFIGRVNSIRRENRALQQFLNLQFLTTDNDQILFFSKATPDNKNVILVAVNLDPLNAHYCTAFVPPEVVGVAPGRSYRVTDLLTGAKYVWSDRNYVRLDPAVEPAHILRVEQRL